MKNMDWFNDLLIGFCVAAVVALLVCVLLPIIVRLAIYMWLWALT